MTNFRLRPVVRTLSLTIALMMAGMCALWVLGSPHQAIPAVLEKRRQIRELQVQNANLERDLQAKRERIRKLKEDRTELKLEIRKRHKLLKKNEMTFILRDQAK